MFSISVTALLVPNFYASNEANLKVLLDLGLLKVILKLLNHSDTAVHCRAIGALCELTAGSSEQVQAVLDAGLLAKLYHYVRCEDLDHQRFFKPAACALARLFLAHNITAGQRQYLVDREIIEVLFHIVAVQESEWNLYDVLGALIELCTTHAKEVSRLYTINLHAVLTAASHQVDSDRLRRQANRLLDILFEDEHTGFVAVTSADSATTVSASGE